jgi:hypothetical protein
MSGILRGARIDEKPADPAAVAGPGPGQLAPDDTRD